MLPCIGSQTQPTVAPEAVTFSTRRGSTSRTLPAPMRVMKRQPAGLAVRVERVDQRERVVRRSSVGPSFTPIGLRILRQQLDVRAVELAGALADPEEVRGDVVGLAGPRVDAGQRALVLEQQRLVAGVDVDAGERVGVDAAGAHELQRPVDLAGEALVALARPGESATKSWFQACTWRRSA